MISSRDACKNCPDMQRGCATRVYWSDSRGYITPPRGCPRLFEHAVAMSKFQEERSAITKENKND